MQLGQSPFSVPSLIQHIGVEIAQKLDRLSELHQILEEGWQQIHSELGDALIRETPVPFYLSETRVHSTVATEQLFAEGISVVHSDNFFGLQDDLIRVAIGTQEMNRNFIEAVQRLNIVA